MTESDIKIKIFSDTQDLVGITSALKQLELKGFPLSISFPTEFTVEQNEIIVLQVDGFESRMLRLAINIKRDFDNKFIIIMRNGEALSVTSIMKYGFYDIFIFPYELLKFTSFLIEVFTNKTYITESFKAGTFGMNKQGMRSIIGESEELIRIVELAKKVSEKSFANILVLGETGTGKGLFARAVHNSSKVSNNPFIDIVCTAIPENLLESELFGYEPGAFTDARTRKIGLFELAERGTLFLDEIGDLSMNIQTKLLRAIEKKIIKRLGGVTDIPINARIISATNRDLEFMVEKNLFRRDLYHRLNVISIELPPLRERGEDIIILAHHFIADFNKQFNKSVKRLDKDIQHFLKGYPWPGNVRELKNAIERAVLLCEDGKIKLKDFSNLINRIKVDTSVEESSEQKKQEHIINLNVNYGATNLKKLEKHYAKEVLGKLDGNKTQTAKLLGISRPKLDSLLK
jgi:two-component system, NtrC family, response regulator AtoC